MMPQTEVRPKEDRPKEDRQQIGEPATQSTDVGARHRSRKSWLVLGIAAIAVAALLVSGIWSRVKAGTTLRAETAQAALPAGSVFSPEQTAPSNESILP